MTNKVWVLWLDPKFEAHYEARILEIHSTEIKAEEALVRLTQSDFGDDYYLWIEEWDVK